MANEQLRPPETITFPWLFEHVSAFGWIKFFSMILAVFLLGITIGYKFPFLPLADKLGFGISGEISALKEEISSLNAERLKTNRTLSETNLKLSEELEKGKGLSEKLSKANSGRNLWRERNRSLKSDLSEKNRRHSALVNTLKQQKKKLSELEKGLQSCRKSPCPKTPCFASPSAPEVIAENFIICGGKPWISPNYDVTVSFIDVDFNENVTLRTTLWEEDLVYGVGSLFSILTSSGCYRFIVKDTSRFNTCGGSPANTGVVTLKIVRIDTENAACR